MECINVPPGQQRDILLRAKSRTGHTWEGLAKSLGVSRSMVYFYANDLSFP
ncbi:MAG: hypothetical protein AABX47_00660 [Nanoarchaeota archaeon]